MDNLITSKPDGFEEECQKIYDIVDQAKFVLLNPRKRCTYNFIHFSQEQESDRRTVDSFSLFSFMGRHMRTIGRNR